MHITYHAPESFDLEVIKLKRQLISIRISPQNFIEGFMVIWTFFVYNCFFAGRVTYLSDCNGGQNVHS